MMPASMLRNATDPGGRHISSKPPEPGSIGDVDPDQGALDGGHADRGAVACRVFSRLHVEPRRRPKVAPLNRSNIASSGSMAAPPRSRSPRTLQPRRRAAGGCRIRPFGPAGRGVPCPESPAAPFTVDKLHSPEDHHPPAVQRGGEPRKGAGS